jgi:aspartate aminotransferase
VPGTFISRQSGAWHLYLDFSSKSSLLAGRGIRTSAELCSALLESTGVAILPGSDFGRPPGELTARIAYVDFDGARALAAAEQHPAKGELGEKFLRDYTPAMVEAIDRIADWVDGTPEHQCE